MRLYPSYSTVQVVNLKGSCIELLEAMLEETNDCSKELVGEIQNAIQIEALHDTMVELYELMNDPGVKAAGQNDEAEAALFRTYHVLVHLTDYGVPLDKVGELSNNYVEYTMNHLTCTVSSCMHVYSYIICYMQSFSVHVLIYIHRAKIQRQ